MNRGEIWLLGLDPTIGAEIQKTRPCVIVNSDEVGILPLKIVVPVTDWKAWNARLPWMVRLEPSTENGLTKVSAADAFQLRSVSHQRFVRRMGNLTEVEVQQITAALSLVLKIRL